METASALKPESCLYLYAVVSEVPGDLNVITGVEEDSHLFAIHSDSLSCIVSNVPASEYCHPCHENPSKQLEWITPRALRHDEIVRHLHSLTTTVPFKFGTLCATSRQLQEILDKFRGSFLDLLDRFKGREEWTVKAYVDGALIAQEVERDPQLRALAENQASQSQGHAYFLQKKKEKLATTLADELIASIADGIQARLQKFTEHIVNGISCSEMPAQPLRSVFNAALLIDKDCFTSLEKVLARVESDYAEYLLVTEISGPWPPYSFSTDLEGFANEMPAA